MWYWFFALVTYARINSALHSMHDCNENETMQQNRILFFVCAWISSGRIFQCKFFNGRDAAEGDLENKTFLPFSFLVGNHACMHSRFRKQLVAALLLWRWSTKLSHIYSFVLLGAQLDGRQVYPISFLCKNAENCDVKRQWEKCEKTARKVPSFQLLWNRNRQRSS
jgi:hypothetical protein